MLNRTNFVLFEWRNLSSGVTWILYTAHRGSWAAGLTRGKRILDLNIVNRFQNTDGWIYESAKIRRLITDKRRRRSSFLERLVRLDKESYERHASRGARGEWIGD
jgi:hypothetical protein